MLVFGNFSESTKWMIPNLSDITNFFIFKLSCILYQLLYHTRNQASQHLLVQNQQWKHQTNVWKMFKVNNKDTRTILLASLRCLYCQLWTNFMHSTGVSVVDFGQLHVSWSWNRGVYWYKAGLIMTVPFYLKSCLSFLKF